MRYEDVVVVTDKGVENFTHFIPMELDAMEAMVKEKGLVQKVPAGPSDEALRGHVTPQKTRTRPAVNSACHTTFTFRPTMQPPAHAAAGVDVHERREHPAIEPQAQVPRERELRRPRRRRA